MRRPTRAVLLAASVAALSLAPFTVAHAQSSYGVGPGREPVPTGFAATIRVPQQAPTIQAAVDRAKPGGMVLIAPGVYHEAVVVRTPYITIRGMDRNTTILDGGFKLKNGILVEDADGVTVQNLTARHYTLNGFDWSVVHGFWGSYLTAYDCETVRRRSVA